MLCCPNTTVHFGPSGCDTFGRSMHTFAANLDDKLLVSRSSFPSFLIVLEADSLLRAAALLLISLLILAIYKLISKATDILQIMIFITTSIKLAARGMLPAFFTMDFFIVLRDFPGMWAAEGGGDGKFESDGGGIHESIV